MSAKLIAGIVAVVVLLAAGMFLGAKVFGAAASTNTVVAKGDVVNEILKISELATISYHTATYEKVEHRSKAMKINVFADADYDLFKFWKGRVKAGVDLDKSHIRVEEASAENKAAGVTQGTVHITLPPGQILSAEPDAKDGFQFFVNFTSTTGTSPSDTDKTSWANEGTTKLREAAKKSGIEKEAQDRAKEILSSFVGTFGYKVTFEISPPAK